MVVWAQQHLVGAGPDVPVTGFFGKLTRGAVRCLPGARGLPADGAIGTATWRSLLGFTPVPGALVGRPARRRRRLRQPRAMPPSRPLSASLPAQAYEIDPGPAP